MPSILPSLHHIHLRKRRYHKNLKKFPNTNPNIKRLDDTMLILGSIAPLFTLPQIITLFVTRDSSGLAWPTYLLLGLTNALWVVYGTVHKDKPLVSASTLFLISNTVILTGIILF